MYIDSCVHWPLPNDSPRCQSIRVAFAANEYNRVSRLNGIFSTTQTLAFQIYAVERQPGAKILCGNSLPLPMTVNYQLNWMYVRFLSDNAGIAGPGFKLTYSHVGGGKGKHF